MKAHTRHQDIATRAPQNAKEQKPKGREQVFPHASSVFHTSRSEETWQGADQLLHLQKNLLKITTVPREHQ